MQDRDLPPLPFDRVSLIGSPFIYENPKRWTWRTDHGPDGYYNLWICRSGSASFKFIGREQVYEVRPWTVLLIPPSVGHCGWNDEDIPDFRNFSAHWIPLGVAEPELVLEPRVLVLREVDTAEALIQSILRVSAYGDEFGQTQAEWLLLSLLGLIWRDIQLPWESPADEIILRQIGRIRAGEDLFADVVSFAEEANMSRVHYTRRFKRAIGLSPNEFLVKQRVECSAVLLKRTDWTLEQIAEVVGYSEQHYFSRQFRQVMGISPGAFRKEV